MTYFLSWYHNFVFSKLRLVCHLWVRMLYECICSGSGSTCRSRCHHFSNIITSFTSYTSYAYCTTYYPLVDDCSNNGVTSKKSISLLDVTNANKTFRILMFVQNSFEFANKHIHYVHQKNFRLCFCQCLHQMFTF